MLQPLKQSQLAGIINILSSDHDLGEGFKKLPWFWLLKTGDGDATPENVRKEVKEATRVKWFHGRELFKQWRKEESWLRREMASVVLDFSSRAHMWEALSVSDFSKVNAGYRAYCLCQRDAWHSMRDDALRRGHHMLA
ncbi:hypothetical protein FRC07_008579, partial [Ceratobasidium sp. 392]